MTTPFIITNNAELASNSAYAPALEYVAPGVVPIIDKLAAYGQPWFDSLLQNVFAINATPEQKDVLIALGERAKAGQPPPAMSDLMEGAGVKALPDPKKLVAGISMLITLANILG